MFTGIVEATGTIATINRNNNSLVLVIKCPFAKELVLGESVAVNGTCLTVTQKDESSFSADVTPESFRRTSLSELESGSIVNLERAMKADGRFGGHIVSGHVDGTGRIISAQKEENAVNVKISVADDLARYIIEKGSVCVDGISLTVAAIGKDGIFSVAVIPHTWENTTLSRKSSGSIVNIECDVVGKYIEHFLTFSTGNNFSSQKNASEISENEGLLDLMSNFTSFH